MPCIYATSASKLRVLTLLLSGGCWLTTLWTADSVFSVHLDTLIAFLTGFVVFLAAETSGSATVLDNKQAHTGQLYINFWSAATEYAWYLNMFLMCSH